MNAALRQADAASAGALPARLDIEGSDFLKAREQIESVDEAVTRKNAHERPSL